ncbi:TPA: serine acetyltransferase, partial [Candidatus Sumerlaeota bacterium]|nr:serine acetyltransferase [Candidatus Sumerlaeota bacterium]
NHIDGLNLPQRHVVHEILHSLFKVIYPGYASEEPVHRANQRFYIGELLAEVSESLAEQVTKAVKYHCRMTECETAGCARLATDITAEFLEFLPALREILKDDIQAAYEGDPAALSYEEICTSYPFLTVITTHRIAHELHKHHVPLIPRIMSERAHSQTGVDIHPGASIGSHFFIDHGTGVVIGETASIGNNVKIYQGVTLGALSFKKDAEGHIMKGGKRHPTICDNVTIYANATILGGDTVIGDGAIIGGSTWITSSVAPGGMVVLGKDGQQTLTEKKK